MFSGPISDENASASGAAFDERRRRMLERLNARYALSEAEAIAVDGTNSAASSRSKSISQFDDLQSRANGLLKSSDACVDHSLLTEIEDALTVLPRGLQSRRLREAYNELRARIQQQVIGNQKKTKFSFSAKPVIKFHVPSPDQKEIVDDNGQSADALQKTSSSAVPFANSLTVTNKVGLLKHLLSSVRWVSCSTFLVRLQLVRSSVVCAVAFLISNGTVKY